MLRNTATSWRSQSLKCHIRIPDPLVAPQKKNLLWVLLHPEVFLFFLLRSSLPGSPFPLFCLQHPVLMRNQRVRQSSVEFPSSLSQRCAGCVFIPEQVTASQPTPIRQVEPEITEQTCTQRSVLSHMHTPPTMYTSSERAMEQTHTHPPRFTDYNQQSLPAQKHSPVYADTLSQNETRIGWITWYHTLRHTW